jgi:hypothetical protein
MRDRAVSFGIGIVAFFALTPSAAFSRSQAGQARIPQQVIINGQLVSGAYVTAAGGQLQSCTCSAPQHYTTADASSQGWACYEPATGVWLLNAIAPAQHQAPQAAPAPVPVPPATVQQPPAVIYQQAPPTVIYQAAPPPTIVYQQPPTVIYQQPVPTVVYAPAPRPVVVAPAYPSSVILGAAAIDAAGRIASAAIANSRHREYYYYYDDHYRRHDRYHDRRW